MEIVVPVAGSAAPSGPVHGSGFGFMSDATCDAVAEVLLASTPFGGFPVADVEHAGISVVTIADGDQAKAEAVREMTAAGVGNELTLQLGGKVDMASIGRVGEPVSVTGTVLSLTDGPFEITAAMGAEPGLRWGRAGCSTWET